MSASVHLVHASLVTKIHVPLLFPSLCIQFRHTTALLQLHVGHGHHPWCSFTRSLPNFRSSLVKGFPPGLSLSSFPDQTDVPTETTPPSPEIRPAEDARMFSNHPLRRMLRFGRVHPMETTSWCGNIAFATSHLRTSARLSVHLEALFGP